MNEFGPIFDICANRHQGSPESVLANQRLTGAKAKQRQEVYDAICRAGNFGLTVKELAEYWNVGMNHISGRFTELKAKNLIRVREDDEGNRIRRRGSAVCVIA